MITTATIDDIPELAELINSGYRGKASRKGWTTEADLLDGTRTDVEGVKDLIARKGTTVLKYVENDEILGCVELNKVATKLYLGMLTVSPRLQNKGIGKQLLQAAEAEAKKLACHSVFMTVISGRDELIAWYLRHGYHDTGERKPFEVPDVRWGIPKQKLEFVVLEKKV